MDLLLNEDEQQIVDSVRDVLSHEFSMERLCKHQPPFTDSARSQWSTLADLGWFSLGLPESSGGLSMSVAEEGLLLREAGRHLVAPGLLATVLAAHAALAIKQPALAAQFAGGQLRAGLLIPQGPLAAGEVVPVYLADAECCDWLVTWNASKFWLVARAALQDCESIQGMDKLVTLERGKLDLAHVHDCASQDLSLRAEVLVAAMLTGLSEGSRDMAVSYANVREQFGKTIGSFQAIKHRCADMAVRCEVAMCQTVWSALKTRDASSDAVREVSAARLLAQQAAEENAAANIQIHGAMGFTDEAGPHHFLKRALLLRQLGDPDAQTQALLE
jgi:alkylation response protein AidB-like acyl-CoA dehydrogenase